MSFQMKYEILFQISVGLEGYSDVLLNDISIEPDSSTSQNFTNFRIITKAQNDRLVVLSEMDPDSDNTRVIYPDDFEFVFWMAFKNNTFKSTFSNLEQYNLETGAFDFSNSSGTELTGSKYMATTYAAYDSSADYVTGYIVSDAGNTYVALKNSGPADPKNPSDTVYWKQLTDGQYVSQSDMKIRSGIDGISADKFARIRIKNSDVTSGWEILNSGTIPKQTEFKIQFKKK